MHGGEGAATTKRWWRWGLGSLALHAALITCAHAPKVDSAYSYPESPLWMEAVPAPEPEPEPPAPPKPAPEEKLVQKPARTRGPAQPKAPRPALSPAQTSEGLSVEASPEGTASGASAADGTAAESGSAEAGESDAPVRPAPAPQLSLWLRPPALQQLVIVRAPTALLQAVPGYRDLLRGSDVAAFSNVERLRLFLPGLSAERLVLAGVHSGGEAEVVHAAERVAATRERVPTWRGSSELRAAAWIDGSGYDRGLAVHGAAFLIGGRAQLPGLLGERASGARVVNLSLMRQEVLLAAVIQNVEHYLPALASCQLRSLRISVTSALRIDLSAELESDADAARVQQCAGSSELRLLTQLLTRTVLEPGQARVRLNTGVTSEDISRLLDELCWALRRVTRA